MAGCLAAYIKAMSKAQTYRRSCLLNGLHRQGSGKAERVGA
jgi:hypothetical protein